MESIAKGYAKKEQVSLYQRKFYENMRVPVGWMLNHGQVTLAVVGGNGVIGGLGQLAISADGVDAYVGLGHGLGLGISSVVGVKVGNSGGLSTAAGISITPGVGPGVTGSITSGSKGVQGDIGAGLGVGTGVASTIGYGWNVITFDPLGQELQK
ncbi:hypothetical protein D9M71_398700 [compost metagenome]